MEWRRQPIILSWSICLTDGMSFVARGKTPRPKTCAQDRPELAGELKVRIEALRGTDPVLDTGATAIFSSPSQVNLGPSGNHDVPAVMHALAVYWPQRHHARGGLGEVLVARQEELGRLVALKRIRPERLQEDARERFLREAEITAGLQHPGIVPIYGLGHDEQGPFYTMPLIDGQTLEEAIHEFHRDESLSRISDQGSLRFRELLQKFTAVCDTVAYAHDQGVVHRDLKPANIMLGRYGETLVMDWGLAKKFGTADGDGEVESGAPAPNDSPHGFVAAGAIMGTPQYMSPEQAKGKTTGPASDVFNLGLILYAVLTGSRAFEEVSVGAADPLKAVRDAAVIPPRQRNPHLPRALEAICLKALAARPEDRYASPRDLGRDLEKWMADEPVTAYRRRWGERLAAWARRHRAWVLAGTAALILVTIVSMAASLGMNLERRKATKSAQAEAAERQRADESKRAALAALHQAKKSAAILTVDTGLRLCEQGEVSHGILCLARAARASGQRIRPPACHPVEPDGLGPRGPSPEVLGTTPGLSTSIESLFADGQSFMTAGRDKALNRGEIRTWNVSSGEPLGPVMSYPIRVWAMAAGSDGKTILSGSGNDATLTREGRDGLEGPARSSSRVLSHPAPVLAAVLSRDGKTVVTGCADGTVRIWDTTSGSPRPRHHRAGGRGCRCIESGQQNGR